MLSLVPPWPPGPGGASVKSLGGLFDASQVTLPNVGWSGFLDLHFLTDSLAALVLGAALGAVIGFHPMTRRTADTLAEAELPKVHVLFAFVGAVIGVTVREFGMVIGVVVFGLGGLMRFRTDAGSVRDSGRLIIATLVGLVAGLGLPHLAVLTTLCAFALIWIFDAQPACRVRIEDLPQDRLAECADAYRAILVAHGARIIGEDRSVAKRRVDFVLRLPRAGARTELRRALADAPAGLCGAVDWDVE